MTADQARLLRMQAQGLDSPAAGDSAAERVAAAARRCGGIQAQDLQASRLAVHARAGQVRLPETIAVCDAGQAVVRSWFMRGTLHMVPAEDAPWLTALLGPVTIAKYRRRRADLGLDGGLCAAALAALPQVLSGGPLDRNAIMAALRADGVPIPGAQAPAHLLIYAACSGVIARGPDRDSEPAYVLRPADQRDAGELVGPAAVTALARRYLAAFGPAGADDFSSWSGLPARACRTAIDGLRGELAEVEVQGQPMWVPAQTRDTWPDQPAGHWQLLPAFDTYLVGYRNRDLLIDPADAKFVYAGGGWIHPSVVRDGQVVGSWRLRRNGAAATADVMLFDGSAPPEQLTAAAARLGRFLGLPVTMRTTDRL